MARLAFHGQGRYAYFQKGYELYVRRARKEGYMSMKDYRRAVRKYCSLLSERLEKDGTVDLPGELGSLSAATITRRPQYRGKKFVGYGAMDYKSGHRDGKLKTFGMVFMPRRGKHECLRSFGFVANRRLFQRMKELFMKGSASWKPMEFNNDMI